MLTDILAREELHAPSGHKDSCNPDKAKFIGTQTEIHSKAKGKQYTSVFVLSSQDVH